MSGRILPVVTGALLLAVACRPPAPPPPTDTETPTVTAEPPPPKRIDRQLMAIADAVDPGEVQPLLTSMPAWLTSALKGRVAEEEDPESMLERVRDDLVAWSHASEGGDQSLGAFVHLGRALYLGERLVLAGKADDAELLVLLERIYALVDLPFFTSEKGFFQQSLGLFIDAAAREGLLTEQAQVGELLGFLDTALGRARALQHRTAARILRDHPDRPEIPAILRRLSEDAERDQQFERALELSTLALARNREPVARDFATHASRCYTALNLECGDEAAAKALAFPEPDDPKAAEEHKKRQQTLADEARWAHEAIDLAGKEGVDEGLRRGQALLLLARYADAEAAYNDLKARFPRDARPHAGLAKLAIQRDFDLFGAAPIIRAARGLDNRDREFYEISLGIAPGRLMAEVIPAATQGAAGEAKINAVIETFLGEFREDARGWAAWEPGRAAVLIALADTLSKILPVGLKGDVRKMHPTLRRLVADFEKIRRKYPDVGDAWQATYVASIFASDPKKAWKTALVPLPESLAGDVELQRKRLRTLRNLVLLWERGDPVADLEAAMAAIPEAIRADEEVSETAAIVDYLRLVRGDAGAGATAIATYTALAERRKGAAKAQALHNLGTLRSLSGDSEGAIAAWEEAIGLADEKGRDIIYLSAAIHTLSPEVLGSLDTLSKSRHSALIRIQAIAWRAEAIRRGGGDAVPADEAYYAAVASEASGELRANLPVGRLGIISTGEFTVNLNYTIREGLTTILAVNAVPWLVPAAPITRETKRRKDPRPKAPPTR
ncbi:MAG: hypothetical protein H6711_30735 [Myxococcales bacterium]|nr:hypothetical protein [Myxococcales bacterium]